MTVDEIEKQMYEDAGGTETTSSVRRKAASQRIVLVKGEQGYLGIDVALLLYPQYP
jgi:hypothetical protein